MGDLEIGKSTTEYTGTTNLITVLIMWMLSLSVFLLCLVLLQNIITREESLNTPLVAVTGMQFLVMFLYVYQHYVLTKNNNE